MTNKTLHKHKEGEQNNEKEVIDIEK
jgi:hypothetical protein